MYLLRLPRCCSSSCGSRHQKPLNPRRGSIRRRGQLPLAPLCQFLSGSRNLDVDDRPHLSPTQPTTSPSLLQLQFIYIDLILNFYLLSHFPTQHPPLRRTTEHLFVASNLTSTSLPLTRFSLVNPPSDTFACFFRSTALDE